MNLHFQLTEDVQKKKCFFAAICMANLCGQILLAFFVLFYLFWNLLADAPPITVKNLGIFLIICTIIFLLIAGRFYQIYLKRGGCIENEIRTVCCSLTANYVRSSIDTHPEETVIINYRDIKHVWSAGRNIFISADSGKSMLFIVIPAAAFQSLEQYKELRQCIKQAVKEQQRSEIKSSILGSFFRSLFGGWIENILLTAKMLAVVVVIGFAILMLLTVFVKLKG